MDPFPPPPQPYRDRRPDALGDFQVLSDETICAILELLSPADLGRLACVSSVLYILCNEEPLWMSQCLKDGGLLEYQGSWKRTILHRQNLCIVNGGVLSKPLQFHGFNSLFLYRRWYRCFTTLSIFSLDNGDIERKCNLTLEEFHSDYDSKKPVLLTDLASTWPARTKWSSVEQLSLHYGDVAFRISQRSSKKITMKLKNYVSYMKLQHDEDPLYIFDDKFGETAPSLLEDYCVPHLFQEDFFDVLDADKRPSYRWIIIGPERSGASWHVDPALTSAWNTLLCGRKRWALYPPGRVPPGVIVHVNEEDGDVNIESPTSLQWWLDIYPHLDEEHKPIECTQLPGETIFVPSGWWHCVLNLETTVAVTQNFVNTSNFHFVCLDMAPGHRHKGVCRAGLLAVEDCGFSSVEDSGPFDGNSLSETDSFPKKKRQKGMESEEDLFKFNGDIHARDASFPIQNKTQKRSFLYDIDFLSSFLEEERDHYNSIWSPSNCIGQREMREWFHKLWMTKPTIRQLIWKGADLALHVSKWYECMMEICMHHNLPSPSDDEELPVGTGSNPVYLVSDYVVKLYVEEGLGTSIHSLGTELQFYDLIRSVKSPLLDHVPGVIASGILIKESGSLQIIQWDGKGVPEVIAKHNLLSGDHGENLFPFGVWSKKEFEHNRVVSSTNIWPYIIIKRCKGDIFANLREKLSKNDVLDLASFLGDQLRNLHLLPLPQTQSTNHQDAKNHSMTGSVDGSSERSEAPVAIASKDFKIPLVWEPIVASLDRKRQNIKKQLTSWGDPIPKYLIEQVDEYIPNEVAMLLDLEKDGDGFNKISGSPTWLHSDIMDDNIHMESCSSICLEDPSFARTTVNNCADVLNGEMSVRKWQATHIIDFSGLSVGHPLYDLIPIYLDVFRGDIYLLKHFLKSYRLPLAKDVSTYGEKSCGIVENVEKFRRISYRAMCYCILNDENILGAIFSLWKELRTAKSWEEVEEAVWGPLNDYQCS